MRLRYADDYPNGFAQFERIPAIDLCLVLAASAKSSRQRRPASTTGLHPKADVDSWMSVFALFTSGIGGKADIIRVGIFVRL